MEISSNNFGLYSAELSESDVCGVFGAPLDLCRELGLGEFWKFIVNTGEKLDFILTTLKNFLCFLLFMDVEWNSKVEWKKNFFRNRRNRALSKPIVIDLDK